MLKQFFTLLLLTLVWFACGNKQAGTEQTAHTTTTTNNPQPTPTPAADPLDAFLTEFKAAVASGDQNKVLALMQFPLKSDFPEKEEFLEMYQYAFDDNSKKKIAACTKADWQMYEVGDSKGLSFIVRSELTPEEIKDGIEGSSTAFMLDKVGESYKIIGVWMAG